LVDSFLAEASLEKPKTLDRLNELFFIWLDECYQNKAHSALDNNMSPAYAYRSDSKPLKFLEPEIITNAFLHCEERKVDKSGCISFEGKKYEAGISFIGCKVDVIYDPADTSELTIEYEGYVPWKAKQLTIGEHTGKRPKLPYCLQPKPAETSRLLKAAALQNEQRKELQAPAVSYRIARRAGEQNV
jgi:hypothetical protein